MVNNRSFIHKDTQKSAKAILTQGKC
jgi:hypothetical protein